MRLSTQYKCLSTHTAPLSMWVPLPFSRAVHLHMSRPNWSETGQSGRSPHDPIEVVRSPYHASRRLSPARLLCKPRGRLAHQRSQKYAVGHSAWRGTVATRTNVKEAMSAIAAPPKESPTCQQPRVNCPASPSVTRDEDVKDLALDDAAHDVGHQYLLGSGSRLRAMVYLGARHAIREARVQTPEPSLLHEPWISTESLQVCCG